MVMAWVLAGRLHGHPIMRMALVAGAVRLVFVPPAASLLPARPASAQASATVRGTELIRPLQLKGRLPLVLVLVLPALLSSLRPLR